MATDQDEVCTFVKNVMSFLPCDTSTFKYTHIFMYIVDLKTTCVLKNLETL